MKANAPALLTVMVVFLFCILSCNDPARNNTPGKPSAHTTPADIFHDTARDKKPVPGDADYPVAGKDSLRHSKKVAAVKHNTYELVFIGNSIIQTLGEFGGRFESLKNVWNRHYRHRKALNLGYSGYRTENILWNLQHGELDFKHPPKLIVLLIGTNNADERRFKQAHTAAQIFDGTKAIVDLVHQKLPATKILVLRIFPRGGDNDIGLGKAVIHSSDSCINTCSKAGKLTEQLADNNIVFWVDINKSLLLANGKVNPLLMPDLLHPNEEGAEAWVEALEPVLSTLLGDNPVHRGK